MSDWSKEDVAEFFRICYGIPQRCSDFIIRNSITGRILDEAVEDVVKHLLLYDDHEDGDVMSSEVTRLADGHESFHVPYNGLDAEHYMAKDWRRVSRRKMSLHELLAESVAADSFDSVESEIVPLVYRCTSSTEDFNLAVGSCSADMCDSEELMVAVKELQQNIELLNKSSSYGSCEHSIASDCDNEPHTASYTSEIDELLDASLSLLSSIEEIDEFVPNENPDEVDSINIEDELLQNTLTAVQKDRLFSDQCKNNDPNWSGCIPKDEICGSKKTTFNINAYSTVSVPSGEQSGTHMSINSDSKSIDYSRNHINTENGENHSSVYITASIATSVNTAATNISCDITQPTDVTEAIIPEQGNECNNEAIAEAVADPNISLACLEDSNSSTAAEYVEQGTSNTFSPSEEARRSTVVEDSNSIVDIKNLDIAEAVAAASQVFASSPSFSSVNTAATNISCDSMQPTNVTEAMIPEQGNECNNESIAEAVAAASQVFTSSSCESSSTDSAPPPLQITQSPQRPSRRRSLFTRPQEDADNMSGRKASTNVTGSHSFPGIQFPPRRFQMFKHQVTATVVSKLPATINEELLLSRSNSSDPGDLHKHSAPIRIDNGSVTCTALGAVVEDAIYTEPIYSGTVDTVDNYVTSSIAEEDRSTVVEAHNEIYASGPVDTAPQLCNCDSPDRGENRSNGDQNDDSAAKDENATHIMPGEVRNCTNTCIQLQDSLRKKRSTVYSTLDKLNVTTSDEEAVVPKHLEDTFSRKSDIVSSRHNTLASSASEEVDAHQSTSDVASILFALEYADEPVINLPSPHKQSTDQLFSSVVQQNTCEPEPFPDQMEPPPFDQGTVDDVSTFSLEVNMSLSNTPSPVRSHFETSDSKMIVHSPDGNSLDVPAQHSKIDRAVCIKSSRRDCFLVQEKSSSASDPVILSSHNSENERIYEDDFHSIDESMNANKSPLDEEFQTCEKEEIDVVNIALPKSTARVSPDDDLAEREQRLIRTVAQQGKRIKKLCEQNKAMLRTLQQIRHDSPADLRERAIYSRYGIGAEVGCHSSMLCNRNTSIKVKQNNILGVDTKDLQHYCGGNESSARELLAVLMQAQETVLTPRRPESVPPSVATPWDHRKLFQISSQQDPSQHVEGLNDSHSPALMTSTDNSKSMKTNSLHKRRNDPQNSRRSTPKTTDYSPVSSKKKRITTPFLRSARTHLDTKREQDDAVLPLSTVQDNSSFTSPANSLRSPESHQFRHGEEDRYQLFSPPETPAFRDQGIDRKKPIRAPKRCSDGQFLPLHRGKRFDLFGHVLPLAKVEKGNGDEEEEPLTIDFNELLTPAVNAQIEGTMASTRDRPFLTRVLRKQRFSRDQQLQRVSKGTRYRKGREKQEWQM